MSEHYGGGQWLSSCAICLASGRGLHRSRTWVMPLTVFDCKGIPATIRERIDAAIETANKSPTEPYEAWISVDPFGGGVRVLIMGPHGFERTVRFSIDEDPAVIRERVRETLEAE